MAFSLPPIPPHVRVACGFLATILVPVASVVEPPWGGVVAVLAVACGLVAGVSVKVPAFLTGSPLLRGSSVVALLPVVGFLVQASATAPDEMERGACLLVAVALSWLLGVPLPQPGQRPAAEVVASHATDTAAALARTLRRP